ncbi:MAG TPA: DNA mismatch endonuclease Vsr, partial [Ktedonobacterales bacterium]|nr:DNA mismatch endonuclease Vsr [Ktedonobacterales bacterium]
MSGGERPARPTRGPDEISAIMRRVHGRDTTPELRLRRALWALGLRYRVAPADLPGKPDLVFPGARLAVFVDGDFWHGNQWRRRRKAALEQQFERARPESRAYWLGKIRRNMRRDAANTAALLADGWTVLRVWESQLAKDLEGTVATIARAASPDGAGEPDETAALRARLPARDCAEFFAGIGLMRLGLERQGWRMVFANDIDERKRAMYHAHFGDAIGPESHFWLGDVHALPAELIPSVTLATASFPCNDLSLAGAREGLAGKQSSAFWGFVQALEALGPRRPPLVLLENVTGFLTSRGGADFTAALQALNGLDYAVDAFILDAASFTPQSRRRLFVVGAREALLPPSSAGDAAPEVSGARPAALVEAIRANASIRWRTRPLPEPPERDGTLASVLEDLPDDAPEWWTDARAAYLLNQMSPRHRALAEAMIVGDEIRYGTVFRRMRRGASMAELRADGLAGCLRTPRGGSGRQIIFKAGQGRYQVRLLTPREAARLMGAGDFQISGSLNDALFGFGDAVCASVIDWIAS